MAYCEQCGTKGYDVKEIRADAVRELLVGPCCAGKDLPPVEIKEGEVGYGVELSSHYGLRAYVEYNGLQLAYRRTPEQLKELFQGPPARIEGT